MKTNTRNLALQPKQTRKEKTLLKMSFIAEEEIKSIIKLIHAF